MNRHRLSDFLAQFLDSRAPVLFIVASLVLALLGNALYELVLLTFGDQRETLIGIVVSAALILPLIYWSFRTIVDAIARSTRQILKVSSSEQITPHRSLILPVGLRDDGPERPILEYHLRDGRLRHCWLILTPAARKHPKTGDLKQWLMEQDVYVYPIEIQEPSSLAESYQATMNALRTAHTLTDALPIAVDITSGTSVMSVGVALAAREQSAPIQYYPALYDADGKVIPNSATAPMLVAFVAGGASTP